MDSISLFFAIQADEFAYPLAQRSDQNDYVSTPLIDGARSQSLSVSLMISCVVDD
jgi:hypothetical protein